MVFLAFSPPGLCEDLRSEAYKQRDLYAKHRYQVNSLEQEYSELTNRLDRSAQHLNQATRYFEAQDNELLISKLRTSVIRARERVFDDYGSEFFSQGEVDGRFNAEIWKEYLLAEDFPSSQAEAQRVARRILAIGGSESLGNSISNSVSAIDQVVRLTISELDELRNKWTVKRDAYYSAEFQNAPLDGSLLHDYQAKHDDLVKRADKLETELASTQMDEELSLAAFKNACSRVRGSGCLTDNFVACPSNVSAPL